MSKQKIVSETSHHYYTLGKRSLHLPLIVDKEDVLVYDYQNPLHTILQNKIISFKNKQISLTQKMKENKMKMKSKSNLQNDSKPKPQTMMIVDNLEESKNNMSVSPIVKAKNKQSSNNISILKEKIYNIDSSSIIQDKEFISAINLKTRTVRAEMYEDLLFNRFNMTNSTVDTKLNKIEENTDRGERENENHVITKFFLGRNIVNKWSQPKNKSTNRVFSAKGEKVRSNLHPAQQSCTSSTSTTDLLKNSKVSVLDIKFKNIRNNLELKSSVDFECKTNRSKSKSANSRKNSINLKDKKNEKVDDSSINPYSNFGKMPNNTSKTGRIKSPSQISFTTENLSKFNLRLTPSTSSGSRLFIKSVNSPNLCSK
jgi:hypothetical protein